MLEGAPSSTALLSVCPSALASQGCMWRLPSSQLVFGVLGDQQDQSLRSWNDYTFLLGGQLESNAGAGLEPLKISRSYSDPLELVSLGIQALLFIPCRRSSIVEEALGSLWHRNCGRQHPP